MNRGFGSTRLCGPALAVACAAFGCASKSTRENKRPPQSEAAAPSIVEAGVQHPQPVATGERRAAFVKSLKAAGEALKAGDFPTAEAMIGKAEGYEFDFPGEPALADRLHELRRLTEFRKTLAQADAAEKAGDVKRARERLDYALTLYDDAEVRARFLSLSGSAGRQEAQEADRTGE